MTSDRGTQTPLPMPAISRPIAAGYGIPATLDGTLPWDWARERLRDALVYWIATTRPDGRPHVMPIWGAWLDDTFLFEGGPDTRRARNLRTNAHAVVHLEHGNDVVIVEGVADLMPDPAPELERRLMDGFAKYQASHDYTPDPANWRGGGIRRIRPITVFGWSDYPVDTTRWRFDRPAPGASASAMAPDETA